ncbi:meiosis regulator and mRNA stability factor 1-like [Strongylocentrotus purpuratus]|uniref:HTH OST-type domain-containing protein n=1 Tax=Strongylocentrotus purpuratus TaxID=7668 RepID=A0A7M7P9Y0_STRPU|nr:meiosis regulator and mRNA stability factor 1-like [Strongylocentrotus purpuratus]
MDHSYEKGKGLRRSRRGPDDMSDSYSGTERVTDWDRGRSKHDHSHHGDDGSRRSQSFSEDSHHHCHSEGSGGPKARKQKVKILQRPRQTSGQRHRSDRDLNSGFRGSSPDVIDLDDVGSSSSQEVSGASSSQYMTAGQDPSPPNTMDGERQSNMYETEKCPKSVGELLKPEVSSDASCAQNPLLGGLPHFANLAGLQATAAIDASISSSIQLLQYYQQQQMLAAHFGLTGFGQTGLYPSLPLAPPLPMAMPCANSLHTPFLPCSCVTCQSAMLTQDLSRLLPQYGQTGQYAPPMPTLPVPQQQGLVPPQSQDVQALLRLLHQNDGHDVQAVMPQSCQECACETECNAAPFHVPHANKEPPPPVVSSNLPMAQRPPSNHSHQGIPFSPYRQSGDLPSGSGAGNNMTPLRQAMTSTLCSSPLQSLITQLNESGLSAVSAIQFQSPDKHNTSKAEENPPIGVFWDIENCAVPRGKSALAVVQRIRDQLFIGHREAEFMCVCDINKESSTIIQELNDSQVTVAHINATAKNAADDKLRQSLRRFADTHSSPATVVLISGDINFAQDLSDLRHRNGLNVILVHGLAASEVLKTCANKAYRYDELLADLPFRSPSKSIIESSELVIHNLPLRKDPGIIRTRLKQLSDNCGGKVGNIVNTTAFIKFPSHEIACRAKKRLEKESVYGNVITTSFCRINRNGYGSPRYGRNNVRWDNDRSWRDGQEEVSSHDSSSSQGTSENQKAEPNIPSIKTYTGPAPKPIPVSVASQRECTSPLGAGKTDMKVSSGLAAAFRPIQPTSSAPPSSAASPRNTPTPPNCEGINLVMDGAAMRSYPARRHQQDADPLLSNRAQSEWKPLIPTPPPMETHSSYGCDAFRPIPSVQRMAGAPGSHLHFRKDGTPGNPYLKGSYRAPSPLMVTSKLKPSWQQQQQLQGGGAMGLAPGVKPWTPMPGIDLLITNLDCQITRKELKRHLVAAISEHCKVLHVFLAAPAQGYFQAVVRVPSMGDAIGVLANVNRRQIGSRLVHISIMPPGDSNADRLRMMIIQMLQEIPGMSMPLYKLRQAFENKYQQQLHVSDLYQIPDTVTMQETHGGKLVCLTVLSASNSPVPGSYNSPLGWQSPSIPFIPQREPSPEPSERFCSRHDPEGQSQYRLLDTDLCVMVAYQTFAAQVTTLLNLHSGSLSLLSFPLCYKAEFNDLDEDFEKGIPLEHLLNSVPGVRVAFCREGFKVICWSQQKEEIITDDGQQIFPPLLGRTTPLLPPALFQFSKEVVELLKHSTKCRLPFTRFVPAYHHHFGRQVRVADYGYLKLIELFEAISHVLEILGATENKTLTLTHRAQVKRFGQDLLKVLKSQASKKVVINDFAPAFQRCLGRPWETADYGICDIQDLLFDLPENWVTIEWDGDNTVISIPKREQTEEECIRTKKFTREIVDLLSRQHRSRITFSKFIPAYHHHFGRQCRVGEYGFNKLAELLGALPEVVQIEEYGDERSVQLTEPERLAVMARRISQLVPRNRQHSLALHALLPAYCKVFGHPVCLEDYDVHDLESLVRRFCHIVEIVTEDDDKRLRSVEREHLSDLTQRILVVLLEQPRGSASVEKVVELHKKLWGEELVATEYGYSSVTLLLKAVHHVVMVKDEWSDDPCAELTPTYQFARSAREVLISVPNQTLTLQAFMSRYQVVHRCELLPHDFGQTTVSSLISSVPRVLTLVGRGAQRAITLNPCCIVSSDGQTYQDHSFSSEHNKTSPSDYTAPSSTTSEKESGKTSSSTSTSESDGVKGSSPRAESAPCDLMSGGAAPSSDQAPFLEPTHPEAPPPLLPPKDLISFNSPMFSPHKESQSASGDQEKIEHIDLRSLLHLLPNQTRFSVGQLPHDLCNPLPGHALQSGPASLPHSASTSFCVDQGGDDGELLPHHLQQRQACSLPSSAASSPRRDVLRGRTRFRLAANFSLGFQEVP